MSSTDIFAISYHSLKPNKLVNNDAAEKEMQQRCANFEYSKRVKTASFLTSTHLFWSKIQRMMYTPVNPSFILKEGRKGVY